MANPTPVIELNQRLKSMRKEDVSRFQQELERNLLQYVARSKFTLDLVPKAEGARLWAHQLQLTVEDFVIEIHNTHHPIAGSLYYREQKREALRRARYFTAERARQFLHYFEHVLQDNQSAETLAE